MGFRLEWNADEAREKLCSISVKNTDLKNSCPEVITCPDSSQLKYAPVDGSCHNLRNPDWGKSNTPFERILGNAYADGNKKIYIYLDLKKLIIIGILQEFGKLGKLRMVLIYKVLVE